MMHLSYQPAFDPFHTVFRVLRQFPLMETTGPLHRDVTRILDFYLLFPFRVGRVRLKPEHRRFRTLGTQYESSRPYSEQPEDKALFDRMEPIQNAAFETLALKGLIDPDSLQAGMIQRSGVPPAELAKRVQAVNAVDAPLLEALAALASEYDLLGPNGLKARTGLMEHRYDAV
ncbi:MAG TPA: ABC-three component system middle component 5 [Mesorhizobium sp.]|jgi:hypothetical protein|nr:ABC-three component system middle component 5 [Mesorhizobium sp.]